MDRLRHTEQDRSDRICPTELIQELVGGVRGRESGEDKHVGRTCQEGKRIRVLQFQEQDRLRREFLQSFFAFSLG